MSDKMWQCDNCNDYSHADRWKLIATITGETEYECPLCTVPQTFGVIAKS